MALAAVSPSEEATLNFKGHRILKKLGEGSYAQVFLVEHKSEETSGRKIQLACRLFDASKAPKDYVRKFLPRELDILVRIKHPHIIHIHSIFQRKHKFFIFMRFAERGDLLEYIMKNGEVNESRARFWCRQIALAIHYLHEMGIAHRDLRCENILITEFMNLKVANFAFSRTVVNDKGHQLLSATYCGSFAYAPPEIIKGIPYNPKISDMWSLGVILFIMLNNSMPFDIRDITKMYNNQINRKFKFRSKVEKKLSLQAKNTISALLQPNTGNRYKIEDLINSDWFAMDPRLQYMTDEEMKALQKARQYKSKLHETGTRALCQLGISTNSKLLIPLIGGEYRVDSLVQDAINNEAAGYSQVSIIKSSDPNLNSSNFSV